MIAQVPVPTGDVWIQFPLVAVIVACFVVAGVGLFIFTKWIWHEYTTERGKELDWRDAQNRLREEAVAEQNRLWREAMAIRDAQIAQRDARYEQYDREHHGTLTKISTSLESVATELREHDQRAEAIEHIVKRVEVNTRPAPGTPGYERRKKE